MKFFAFICCILLFQPYLYGKKPVSQKNKKTVSQSNTKITSGSLEKEDIKGFIESLGTIEQKKISSKDYNKAVTFLESSFYNDASFETLSLLANTYKKRGDLSNEIKVKKIIISDYPDNPKSHYILGLSYRDRYLKNKNSRDHYLTNKANKDMTKAINYFSNAIKKDSKYEKAYLELLSLLTKQGHTSESLSLVLQMIRNLKKKKYYVDLCQAYFETNFFSQSSRACKKATEKNPDNPISQLLYILSQPQHKAKNIKADVTKIASKYKDSHFVQIKTALFFKDENPSLSIKYFQQAVKLNPDSIKGHKNLSQLFFAQGKFKNSNSHFLKACLLTKGAFLTKYQFAKSQVRRKAAKFKSQFEKGTEKCFLETRPQRLIRI